MNPILSRRTPSHPLKSLLVGAAGQVGAQMLLQLGSGGALPTSRTPSHPSWLALDLATLSQPTQAEALLATHPLDAIYCIAGMTDVEACGDQITLAHATNARGPAVLATYAHAHGLPFVYVSTEYIFDGHAGPYSETDLPNPLSVYGQSKLAGEQQVVAAHPGALILRTTVVYGPDQRHKNFVYSLMAAVAANRPMRVASDQISTPTYNRDLVRTAAALVAAGATGTYHVCGPELLSRIDFAQQVARTLGLDIDLLQPTPTAQLYQRAARPLNAGLRIDKLTRDFPNLPMRPLAASLDDCAADLLAFFHARQALNREAAHPA